MTHSNGVQLIAKGYAQGSNEPIDMGGTTPNIKQPNIYENPAYTANRTESSQSISALLNQFGFSPELVLYIANSRMNDIDGQVRASMIELEETAAESKKIGDQISALHKLQEQMTGTENGKVLLEAVDGDEEHNFFVLPNGEQVNARQYLERVGIEPGKDLQTCLTRDSERPAINAEAIDARLKQLEEQQQKINTGNELRMAKMQSLVQQRTQIISLTTNLLQKLDEGMQSIMRNLA